MKRAELGRFDTVRNALKAGLLAALAPAAVAIHGPALAQGVSVSGFPTLPPAPAGAPNVIVIMTDDVGFASGSTFGGAIPTPTMDQLAENGLRYSNFHTNALCSPSRAALLTGRNAHAVGFGGVTDFGRGQPGYNTVIPKSAASVGQIFKMNGYDTAWFGKNHNVPTWQNGPLGPFDQWASGLGFDYFYGFIGGLTDQFHPILVQNNATIEPPNQPDYVLDRDLADHTIEWIRAQRAQGGGRPFLIHYAPGSAHGPLQAPADWIAKFKGKFDSGWDALRAETFARQKRLGVIPVNATIAPPPPGMPAWDSLSANQRKLFARYMEVFAAQLAFCDAQIGRVVDALRDSGQLENTIIIYIQGDNGASPEGGLHGTINYTEVLDSSARRPDDDTERALKRIDEIGGPTAYPMMPFGWTVAMDTPYPYFKTVSSRLGALTNGMVISWPKSILARGERRQFTHLVDVLPTIVELTKVKAPAVINGVTQQPFDGVSFAYSIDHPEALSRHRTQYFEVAGHAALYQDGWLAASPLKGFGQGPAPALDPHWELYDLNTDSSQTINVAAQYPEKLQALRRVFDSEARRNHVLPISNETTRVLLPESRPEVLARPGRYIFYPSDLRYSESTFPNIKNRSWTAEADIVVPDEGGDGVLITEGGRFSGWGLAVLKGVPTFLYRVGDGEAGLTRIAAPTKMSPGAHKVKVDFTIDGVGLGKGAAVSLFVDGKPSGQTKLERTIAFKFTPEGGAVGHDTGTPLVDDYRIPATYQGELKSVTIELQPVQTPTSAQK